MASYGIELSGKELIYLLFKKKYCPKCGYKMKREKKKESMGIGNDTMWIGREYYGERHEISLFYNCSKCGKTYPISELAENTNAE